MNLNWQRNDLGCILTKLGSADAVIFVRFGIVDPKFMGTSVYFWLRTNRFDFSWLPTESYHRHKISNHG